MVIRVTDPDPGMDPDRDHGKTCLGGGVNCPSASSFFIYLSELSALDPRTVPVLGLWVSWVWSHAVCDLNVCSCWTLNRGSWSVLLIQRRARIYVRGLHVSCTASWTVSPVVLEYTNLRFGVVVKLVTRWSQSLRLTYSGWPNVSHHNVGCADSWMLRGLLSR